VLLFKHGFNYASETKLCVLKNQGGFFNTLDKNGQVTGQVTGQVATRSFSGSSTPSNTGETQPTFFTKRIHFLPSGYIV
jgi:hypothetical protein